MEKHNIKVKKRDGTKQDFDPNKIAKVVAAAGLPPDGAKELSENVSSQIIKLGMSEVNSKKIRELVLKELEHIDPYAANLFEWYEKRKDKDFKDGIYGKN